MVSGKTVEVRILLIDGHVSVVPAVRHAERADMIHFRSNGIPFGIQFKGLSPLEKADFQSDPNNEALVKVCDNAPPGVYPYVYAVYVEGRIHIDAACPSIIIDW